jgi:ribosome-associated protein
VRQICSFADYFVLCSGESERQIGAIYEEVDQALRKVGASPHHSEGTPDSGWVLMDFGDIIIHIFSPFERAYYQLEKLWSAGFLVVRIQ